MKEKQGKVCIGLRETTTAKMSYDREMQRRLWDETTRLLGKIPCGLASLNHDAGW